MMSRIAKIEDHICANHPYPSQVESHLLSSVRELTERMVRLEVKPSDQPSLAELAKVAVANFSHVAWPAVILFCLLWLSDEVEGLLGSLRKMADESAEVSIGDMSVKRRIVAGIENPRVADAIAQLTEREISLLFNPHAGHSRNYGPDGDRSMCQAISVPGPESRQAYRRMAELGLFSAQGDWDKFIQGLEALGPGAWRKSGDNEEYVFDTPVTDDAIRGGPSFIRTDEGDSAVYAIHGFIARELGAE